MYSCHTNQCCMFWPFCLSAFPVCHPIRHKILGMLSKNPPFTKTTDSVLCNEALVDQLWKLMNSGETHTWLQTSRLSAAISSLASWVIHMNHAEMGCFFKGVRAGARTDRQSRAAFVSQWRSMHLSQSTCSISVWDWGMCVREKLSRVSLVAMLHCNEFKSSE